MVTRQVRVTVQQAQPSAAGVPDAECVSDWVQAAVAQVPAAPAEIELTVRFVDTDASAALNSQYRGKQGATNVLAFPTQAAVPGLAADADAELGDLVICWPLTLREAAEQGKTAAAHAAHLTVHGTLHLLGFDHEDSVAAEAMEALERHALATLEVPDPYAGER